MKHVAESVAYAAFAPGVITNAFGEVIGEAGMINQKQEGGGSWYTADLQRAYSNPVVLMNATTYNGGNASHIRLRPKNGSSFQYQVEEWDYLDQAHTNETIAFLVVESGIHELPGGRKIEAGTIETDHQWRYISFSTNFASSPITLSQSQTCRGGQAVVTRQRSERAEGFELRLQEEEANDGNHTTESVGYVAIAP